MRMCLSFIRECTHSCVYTLTNAYMHRSTSTEYSRVHHPSPAESTCSVVLSTHQCSCGQSLTLPIPPLPLDACWVLSCSASTLHPPPHHPIPPPFPRGCVYGCDSENPNARVEREEFIGYMLQQVEKQTADDRPSPEEIVDLLWERLDEDESGQVFLSSSLEQAIQQTATNKNTTSAPLISSLPPAPALIPSPCPCSLPSPCPSPFPSPPLTPFPFLLFTFYLLSLNSRLGPPGTIMYIRSCTVLNTRMLSSMAHSHGTHTRARRVQTH